MTTGLAAVATAPRRAADGYIGAIDGLRAIAVLSVMVGHLDRAWLPGGFTGVDVFFTISGFVVTLSMMDQRFARVRDMVAFFYARRLRRIAPALIVMLLVATLASVLFVPDAWLSEAIPRTGLAAFFGLSNVVLAAQTEAYFAPHAEFNTFLHTWSLGVEEQFYLVFPALMALVTVERLRRWRGLVVAILVALSAASLAYCAWLTPRTPVSAFFLLPARFWELGVGMILALTLARWRSVMARWRGAARDGLAGLALAGLAATFALATETAFPFPWAVPPVVATLLLIISVSADETGHAAGALAWRPVAYVGRISYSLYLWHWPVYVLMRWTCGLDGIATRAVAIALTFVLAALSYRFVEQPFRSSTRPRRWPRIAVVGFGVAALTVSAGLAKAAFVLSPVLSLSQTRDVQIWSPYSAPPASGCRVHASIRWKDAIKIIEATPVGCEATNLHLIVAGDSHAGAYLRMLRRLSQMRHIEVSLFAVPGGCAFIDLMTPVAKLDASCKAANHAIRDAILARAQTGDVVFLASLRMHRYRDQDREVIDLGSTVAPQGAFDDARAFVAALSARKLHVVLEAPKPVFKSPPFRCVDWFDRMNPICAAGFSENRADFERKRAPVLDRERALAALPGVTIWDPSTVLCGPSTCDAFVDGAPLVFDTDHLTGAADDRLLPSFEAHLDALH